MRRQTGNPSPGIDAEDLVPKTQSRFRLDQVAELLSVSVLHVFNLIGTGARDLKVLKERIESAPSRGSILIDRSALVRFLWPRLSQNVIAQRDKKTARRKSAKR
jgi:hypothetical protein